MRTTILLLNVELSPPLASFGKVIENSVPSSESADGIPVAFGVGVLCSSNFCDGKYENPGASEMKQMLCRNSCMELRSDSGRGDPPGSVPFLIFRVVNDCPASKKISRSRCFTYALVLANEDNELRPPVFNSNVVCNSCREIVCFADVEIYQATAVFVCFRQKKVNPRRR